MDIHTNSGQVLMPGQVLEAHEEDYGPVTKLYPSHTTSHMPWCLESLKLILARTVLKKKKRKTTTNKKKNPN